MNDVFIAMIAMIAMIEMIEMIAMYDAYSNNQDYNGSEHEMVVLKIAWSYLNNR